MSMSDDLILSMCIPFTFLGIGLTLGLLKCYYHNNLHTPENSYPISEPKSYTISETNHENVVIICENPAVHITVVYVQPTSESSIQT